MNLKLRLSDDMKDAMRARDAGRLAPLRLLHAAIRQREIDERIELDDTQVIGVLEKLLKQRRESIAQYDAAGRTDLAEIERCEATVLSAYLPEPLDAAALQQMIEAAIAACEAKGIKDMGKVMTVLRPQLAGRADGAQVSALVRTRLADAGG